MSILTTMEKTLKINEFCITFSTINGSGSATANTTILRALFRMGIPVSGKNIFPSNIQGQPTWYSIRVSKNGYLARLEDDDIVVAMNPATAAKEVPFLKTGGVLFYADDIQLPELRPDVIAYPMPVKKIVKEAEVAPALRDYIANMVYVGVVAQMLGIEMDMIREALDFQFKGKAKPIESNMAIIQSAATWAAENLEKKDVYKVERMDGTDGCIMADGNTAAALGAIYGGVQFVGWYPITPATTLAETLNEYLPMFRRDPETGKATYVVVQSEDELAAIGMAIGAGWGGLRSMTSTSGPGLSLMSEYLGLAYYTEVPVVVWDVQRVGPSTGMPTRTAQGDITQGAFISHGDRNFIMLFPGSVSECFEFGWRAFDIAERLQTPVLVMIDLDLGMNQWMTPKFVYPTEPMDRGKVLWEEDLDKIIKTSSETWGRYKDIDGDGIPYRTVVGNRHPNSGYFTRGTGHDEMARYSEDPQVWEDGMNRLLIKFETAKQYLPKPELSKMDHANVGIISYGSVDPAVAETRDQLKVKGIATDYLRLRAYPFQHEVEDFVRTHERIYVAELNRDGQMRQLLTLAFPEFATRFLPACHLDGLPMTANWLCKKIEEQERN